MSDTESALRATIVDLRGDLAESVRERLILTTEIARLRKQLTAALDVGESYLRFAESYADELKRERERADTPLLVPQ